MKNIVFDEAIPLCFRHSSYKIIKCKFRFFSFAQSRILIKDLVTVLLYLPPQVDEDERSIGFRSLLYRDQEMANEVHLPP
jgi:hypothetical protein